MTDWRIRRFPICNLGIIIAKVTNLPSPGTIFVLNYHISNAMQNCLYFLHDNLFDPWLQKTRLSRGASGFNVEKTSTAILAAISQNLMLPRMLAELSLCCKLAKLSSARYRRPSSPNARVTVCGLNGHLRFSSNQRSPIQNHDSHWRIAGS